MQSVAKLTLGQFGLFPDQGALRETPLRESDPAAPPERTARALERSAAEPLGLGQRRESRDTILNFLGQQQEKLERDRERTTEQLASTVRELKPLHWWNRDRRTELEAEITLHREALGRADHRESATPRRRAAIGETCAALEDARARQRTRRTHALAQAGTIAPQSGQQDRPRTTRSRT